MNERMLESIPRRGAAAPPGPRGIWPVGPIVGATFDPRSFYSRLQRKYGDVVGYRIASHRFYMVNDPDGIQAILAGRPALYQRHAAPGTPSPFVGLGLIRNEGAPWKKQRSHIQTALSREQFAAMMPACLNAFADSARLAVEQGRVELFPATRRMMFAGMSSVLLSSLPGEDVYDAFCRVLEAIDPEKSELVRIFQGLALIFAPAKLPPPTSRSNAMMDGLNAWAHGLLGRSRAPATPALQGVMERLAGLREPDGAPTMDEQKLRDELMTLYFTSFTTLSKAMGWTLCLLGAHPEAMRRVRAELDEVCGARLPQADDLAKLTYLGWACQESMRLFPPQMLLIRYLKEPDELCGYRLEPGAQVHVCTWTTHRHPAFWTDPESFVPERFRRERAAEIPRWLYLPFGGGQRACVASHLSAVMLPAAIATLLQLADVALPSRALPALAPGFTLRPRRPVHVELTPRLERPALSRAG